MKLVRLITIFNLVLLSTVFAQDLVQGQDGRAAVQENSIVPQPDVSSTTMPSSLLTLIGSNPSQPAIQLQSNLSIPKTSVNSGAALVLPGGIELPDLTSFTLPPLFGPTPCIGTNLMSGTCQREAECGKSGGQPAGPCALNLGVCCTKTSQCGETVRLNESIFTNPNYPDPSPLTELCSMSIVKLPGVAQVRLDILDLQIGEVDEGGKCSQDALVIEGLNPGFPAPRLCGFMSNQHMYLPVDGTAIGATVTLRLILSPVPTPRLFKIKVTQIPLGSPLLAPPGCLQYHTSASGTVNSFNFDSAKNVAIRNIGGMSYAICFRQEPGMCSVLFEPSRQEPVRSLSKRSVDPLAPSWQATDPLGAKGFPRSAKYISYDSPRSAYPPKAYQGYQIQPSRPKTYDYRKPAPTPKQYVPRPVPQRPVYRQRPSVNVRSSYKQSQSPYYAKPSASRPPKQSYSKPNYPAPVQQQTFQKPVEYQAPQPSYQQPQTYQTPAPQPLTYQAPAPQPPTYQAPTPTAAQTVYQPVPAPQVYQPAPAPQVYQPAPAPQVYQPAPAPQVQQPAPVPQVRQAPVQVQVYQAPAPAPSPVYAPVEKKVEVVVEKKKIPDLVEAKVDVVTSLIDEKTRILNSLLNATGTGLPSALPTVAPVPTVGAGIAVPAALPIVPQPVIPSITDAALKPFLPSLAPTGTNVLGPLLPGAPVDMSSLAACDGKDSIGIPPSAVLCEDSFRPVVLSTAPFMVFVDNHGSTPSKGFSFNYRQQICS